MCPQPGTLLVYNTVERLLRGDFFHCATRAQVQHDLGCFHAERPLAGVGTTNWHRRHGELIVEGRAGDARFLWADPISRPTGRIVDLAVELPDPTTPLRSPAYGQPAGIAHFPFVAVAIGTAAGQRTAIMPADATLHEWLEQRMQSAQIGLAGITVEGLFARVAYTAICHIPFTGLDLREGYVHAESFTFGQADNSHWRLSGVYAANPTIQAMVSVVGHGLHAHGYASRQGIGGHVQTAVSAGPVRVTYWPLHDLVLKIANLHLAHMPVNHMIEQV